MPQSKHEERVAVSNHQPSTDPLIWKAIEEKRLIRLLYKIRERIIEPHDYGIQSGLVKLLVSSQWIQQWSTSRLEMDGGSFDR